MDSSHTDLNSINDEIAREMGICIILLQQYEQGLKQFIATQEIAGSIGTVQDNLARRRERLAKQTLGALSGQLVGTYLRAEDQDEAEDSWETDSTEFQIRISAVLPKEEFQRTSKRLEDFVALRNDLVHHFTGKFNLHSYAECQEARKYLEAARETIKQNCRQLGSWIEAANKARKELAELFNSPGFDDWFVFGIVQGEPINWPQTTIIQHLRAVEHAFNDNGWTCLARARAEFDANWHYLTPKKYGCSSWRHLLHESRLFEVQKRKAKDSGEIQVWYRSRPIDSPA